MKQKLTEVTGEIDNSTIKAGDFNTPLEIVGRQKVNREIEDLSNSVNQLNLINISEHSNHTHSSKVHIEYLPDREMLGYMTSLNKLKRREIIQNMFSNHNTIEIRNQ